MFSHGIKKMDEEAKLKPKPPLDPAPSIWGPKPKKGGDDFEILIDPVIRIDEEALRRIEKQLRQAVLIEIAALELFPDIVISAPYSGRRGIELRVMRE